MFLMAKVLFCKLKKLDFTFASPKSFFYTVYGYYVAYNDNKEK